MNQRISRLPLEIQSIIREETPIYARLSKSEVVGEKRLRQLCDQDISKQEFLNYIKIYQPDHFIMYSDNNDFVVFVADLYGDNYIITTYTVRGNNRIQFSSKYIQDVYDIEEYVMALDDLYYDINTTYTIWKYLRTVCDNNDYIKDQFNKHINMNGVTDLNILLNQIKTCIYLVSNEVLINKTDLKIFMIPLTLNFRNLTFDRYGNYTGYDIDLDNAYNYLNEIYHMTFPLINDYIQ